MMNKAADDAGAWRQLKESVIGAVEILAIAFFLGIGCAMVSAVYVLTFLLESEKPDMPLVGGFLGLMLIAVAVGMMDNRGRRLWRRGR